MPQAGFESTTQVTEHKTYVLDRAATDTKDIYVRINEEMNEWMERRGPVSELQMQFRTERRTTDNIFIPRTIT
jgi:hypothetical protein